MRRARGAKAAILFGVGLLAVLGLALVFRREFAVRYHVWRLDRAMTFTEARPWLERLTRDFETPGLSAVVANKLGPKEPKLTFWVFFYLRQVAQERSPTEEFFSPGLSRLLSLIRDLEARIRSDGTLLLTWGHFVRWSGREGWQLLDEVAAKPKSHGWIDLDLSDEYLDSTRREPEVFEANIRLLHLEIIGEAWILGMSPLPELPDFKLPLTKQDLDFTLEEQVSSWLKDRKETLRFDPELGRCVPRLPGDAPRPVTVPTVPLPEWKGPVPETASGPDRTN
jgi:hypothetical protein